MKENKELYKFRLEPSTLKKLKSKANKLPGNNVSALIRWILNNWLKRNK